MWWNRGAIAGRKYQQRYRKLNMKKILSNLEIWEIKICLSLYQDWDMQKDIIQYGFSLWRSVVWSTFCLQITVTSTVCPTFCLEITVTSTVFVFYFLFRDHSRNVNHEASDRERSSHEDSSDHGSAFEAYRKPAMSTFGKVPAGKGFEPSKHIRWVIAMNIHERIMNVYWIGHLELVTMYSLTACSTVFSLTFWLLYV